MNSIYNKRTVIFFLVLFCIAFTFIQFSPLGLYGLHRITGGPSILDLSFPWYSADDAYEVFTALGPEGRVFNLTKILPLDIFFPLSYGFFFCTLTGFMYKTGGCKKRITDKKVKEAVIIGTGFIGLEVCENLSRLGIKVILVEKLNQVTPGLDADMAVHVQKHLEKNGVKVYTGVSVSSVDNGSVALSDNTILRSDITIIAAGVKPETALAKDAGLELGISGAIKVNEKMQTSDPNIYACGDCIEHTHLVTGKKVWRPLGSTANKTGRILGVQIIGENGVDKRVDVFVTAITFGAKVSDLFHLDLAYAPPFSTTKDPVMYTGMILDNAINRGRPLATKTMIESFKKEGITFSVIDARVEKQYEHGHVENAQNIPLEQLRNALSSLNKEEVVITYCNKGTTGNAAQNIMINSGFKRVYNVSGGFTQYKVQIPDRQ